MGLLRNLMLRRNTKLPLIPLKRFMFKIRVRDINNFSFNCSVWLKLGLGACEMCDMCRDFFAAHKRSSGVGIE